MKRVGSLGRSWGRFSKKHPTLRYVIIFVLGAFVWAVVTEFGTDVVRNLKDWWVAGSGGPKPIVSTLKEQTETLYEDIMNFVKEREANEPQIDYNKWEESTNALIKYSQETMGLYDVKFGSRVVAIREEYVKLGIKSDRLDQFYEHPTNPLGIREVALGLAELAAKLK